MSLLNIVQFSDCHLYADQQAQHFGANVYRNLERILQRIRQLGDLDAVIFTGDLSQDHSALSYQLFDQLVGEAALPCPVYVVAGNHDDPRLLKQMLSSESINHDKVINLNSWQIRLIDSKSETPSGLVSERGLTAIASRPDKGSHSLLFMHHHPLDVGYFIDRHGLINKHAFWSAVQQNSSIRGIACGHVHRGQTYYSAAGLPIFACPATSIQFDPHFDGVKALNIGPGFRQFYLHPTGKIDSQLYYLRQ
ncbi:metallophosphoesterase [Thalassotalea ponticola]|uniref:metallophosphoesterase n=1 Tax=Thalassotalea ponticola TaxID=1523392 RepID=UPI0025B53C7C|nr:metallophosphoesterase [Thalassotalea ponticola]MDN3653396.1 metallophosphoesterase [Thalassotalea ponticola]